MIKLLTRYIVNLSTMKKQCRSGCREGYGSLMLETCAMIGCLLERESNKSKKEPIGSFFFESKDEISASADLYV